MLAGGGALVALGGLVRLGGDTFAGAMAGQVTVAVAQPIVLSAVSKLAGDTGPLEQRASGISVGSAGSFLGILIALVLGAMLGAHWASATAVGRGRGAWADRGAGAGI